MPTCAIIPRSPASGPDEPEPWLALEPLPPLDRIVPRHIAYVRSVVARFSVSPPHWREDITQEVMIEAHRSRGSRLEVRALLFGITRHLVFRWMARRHAERAGAALLARTEPVSGRSVEEEQLAAEERDVVRAVIAGLPDIYRQVLLRTEIQDMSMPEAARDLGIPVNTGYTRLRLARACCLGSLRRVRLRRRVKGRERAS